MATLSYLTDVIGPRLTGSPNMKRANEWTRDKLAAWGAANAHLEAWGPFGRGWTLKRFSAQVIEPQCIPLIGFPKAWSPGTDGTLTAKVVYFDAKTEADFAAYKGKLKGAIVLTSPIREVAARGGSRSRTARPIPSCSRWPTRPSPPHAAGRSRGPGSGTSGGRGRRPRRAGAGAAAGPQPSGGTAARRGRFNSPEFRAQQELQRKKTQFLADEGVAMLVDPSTQGDGGTFFVQSATVPGAPLPTPGQTRGPARLPVRQRRTQDHPPARPRQGALQPPGPDVRAGRKGQDGRRPGGPVS